MFRVILNIYECTCSCSRQKCLAGSRFFTPSLVMAIVCWTRDKWMIGKQINTNPINNFNCLSCELHAYFSHLYLTNRDDFSVKLALLSNQWQCVVRRAQQRRGIIDSLVRQWINYREMAEKLIRWLQEVTHDPDVHQPGEAVALQQARNLLDQIQVGYYAMKGLLHFTCDLQISNLL